ncbi:alpha/beta fold hydrolase [Actinomycetospora endophytica]|uniref:Alpha/beta fold hydrolase n=1 Tax=Actinomycetospora endophytica TaxID=2291215 RepID=A0ABS8PBX8_9PSEU|nr:alpha/beta fold hydrolase [Actinomycetospora endophytica]MCD2195397.1 alpha/beta fold hydrolase [Actinomycetospora endophytica]
MTLVLHDDLFDAQFVRALAYVRSGGAEVGECIGTAHRITTMDPELWYREWLATAQRAEQDAVASSLAGDRAGARGAYLRASNYYRTAGLFLMGAPVDDRFRHAAARQTDTFRSGAALFASPPEILAIPYEGTTLPGYFFRAADDGRPRPTVILTNGYDGTVEELYFANGAAALERGYHVLAFDGPGQGSVILDQGIPFRPDWENVVTPVVDLAVARPDVDPDRLVLIGWSFGGYTAPRAATVEHRLAACVADSGPYDLYDAAVSRIPGALAHQLPDGNRVALALLDRALDSTMHKPSAGWALRRNLWVHGVDDPMAFLEIAPQYTLKGREHLIRCPTFVCHTAGDDISADARAMADALTCPHEYVEFGDDDDVSGHCEMTGRAVFHEHLFRWLAGVLRETREPALARENGQ